jgi:xanthine dehydrogenase accessory factor
LISDLVHSRPSIFHLLEEISKSKERAALGIITHVKGSSPQKIGAKAIFYSDGRIDGTLGGGCLEAEIQHRAQESLITQIPSSFELVLDHDFGWDDGLICGGKVCGVILPNVSESLSLWKQLASREETLEWGITKDFQIARFEDPSHEKWIYREAVKPRCSLWIAGAGHIAQAVAPLALRLDFDVTVFDDRPALANTHFFPSSTHIRADTWDVTLQDSLPPTPTFALIVTRGHRHDALVLRKWITQPFAFIGMIGSKRKSRIIYDHFLEEKIANEETLRKVACPVGLDIEAASVDEIAVSIIAQLIQKRAELQAISSISLEELLLKD